MHIFQLQRQSTAVSSLSARLYLQDAPRHRHQVRREVDHHVLPAAGFAEPLLDFRRVAVGADSVRVDPIRDLRFVRIVFVCYLSRLLGKIHRNARVTLSVHVVLVNTVRTIPLYSEPPSFRSHSRHLKHQRAHLAKQSCLLRCAPGPCGSRLGVDDDVVRQNYPGLEGREGVDRGWRRAVFHNEKKRHEKQGGRKVWHKLQ